MSPCKTESARFSPVRLHSISIHLTRPKTGCITDTFRYRQQIRQRPRAGSEEGGGNASRQRVPSCVYGDLCENRAECWGCLRSRGPLACGESEPGGPVKACGARAANRRTTHFVVSTVFLNSNSLPIKWTNDKLSTYVKWLVQCILGAIWLGFGTKWMFIITRADRE